MMNPHKKLHGKSKELKRVGYWFNYEDPDGTSDLPKVSTMIDLSWAKTAKDERNMVIAYLDCTVGFQFNNYKGHSECRICCTENGSADVTDGEWIWPDGFTHYIEDHNVKPPKEFIKHAVTKYKSQHQGK